MHVVQMIDILSFGGAQTMQLILAQAIRKHNVKLTLISLSESYRETPTPDQLSDLGVRVVYYKAKTSKNLLDLHRIWEITQFMRREKFDIVHAHLTYANIIGTIAGRLAGIPVITTLQNARNEDDDTSRRKLESWVMRYFSDRIMAVGHATAKARQEYLGDKKIYPIPTALKLKPTIIPDERLAAREELLGDPNRPLIISVGRLVNQKGYKYLIPAFAQVHKLRGHMY